MEGGSLAGRSTGQPSWVTDTILSVHQSCLLRLRGLWASQQFICSIRKMRRPVASKGWPKSPSRSLGQERRLGDFDMSTCLGPHCAMTAKAEDTLEASRERALHEAELKAAASETARLPRSLPPPGSAWLVVFTPQHKPCRQHQGDSPRLPPPLAASPNHLLEKELG